MLFIDNYIHNNSNMNNVHLCRPTHIDKTAVKPGAGDDKTALNKIDKYTRQASSHIFYLFAIETAGTQHDMAIAVSYTHLTLPTKRIV